MMGAQETSARLFYDFCLDDHVPSDHMLRSIDRHLNLEGRHAEQISLRSYDLQQTLITAYHLKNHTQSVLEAFDTLFNKRDYEAAARLWSDTYIQHSAHIEPRREGLFKRGHDIFCAQIAQKCSLCL
jgi:hypothetical protein